MNCKHNISRILVLVFILSGAAEFVMDYVAGNAWSHSKSTPHERPEFQRFLKSNSLPLADNFSRTKTETECEEETNHDTTFTSHNNDILDVIAAIETLARHEITRSFYTDHQPVFLRHRQFRI